MQCNNCLLSICIVLALLTHGELIQTMLQDVPGVCAKQYFCARSRQALLPMDLDPRGGGGAA